MDIQVYNWSFHPFVLIETPFFVFLILPKLFRGNMIIGEGWIGLMKINVFVVVTSCCESLCNSPRNNNFCGHKTTLMPKHTTIIICFKVYLYFQTHGIISNGFIPITHFIFNICLTKHFINVDIDTLVAR